MKHMKSLRLGLVGLALTVQPLFSFAPSTGARSFDQALRPAVIESKKYHVRVGMESSTAVRPYNMDGRRCDPLRVYDDSEATIMMLRNPLADRRAAADSELRNMGNPADDGVRGHMRLSGSYNEISIMPSAGAWVELKGLPGSFGIDVHVPIVRKQVSLAATEDLTNVKNLPLPQDLLVAPRMPFIRNFMDQNGRLNTENVTATGLGDMAVILAWRNYFKQDKELIRGVELFAQTGINLPTGKEREEDRAFSMALGSDAAFGIPVGLGLNVEFINTIKAGLNVDFLAYLDKTRERRLKTLAPQTELFLLNKGKATKDYGLNWQFYLYLQSYHFVGGLSAKAAYQYLRHDADKLTPRDNGFSYDVINTSKRLSEWYAHNVIFSLDYDHVGSGDHLVTPQLGVFYKLPVGGKGVLGMQSVGVNLGANF